MKKFSKVLIQNIDQGHYLENGEYEITVKLSFEDAIWCKLFNNHYNIDYDRQIKKIIKRVCGTNIDHIFRSAIEAGDINVVNEILERSVNLNWEKNYDNLLICSCYSVGKSPQILQFIKYLLNSGANPNCRGDMDKSALTYLVDGRMIEKRYREYHQYRLIFNNTSIEHGNWNLYRQEFDNFNKITIEAIDLLISHGADLFSRDEDDKLVINYSRTIDIYLHLKKLYVLHFLRGGYFSVLSPDLIKYYIVKFFSDEQWVMTNI